MWTITVPIDLVASSTENQTKIAYTKGAPLSAKAKLRGSESLSLDYSLEMQRVHPGCQWDGSKSIS